MCIPFQRVNTNDSNSTAEPLSTQHVTTTMSLANVTRFIDETTHDSFTPFILVRSRQSPETDFFTSYTFVFAIVGTVLGIVVYIISCTLLFWNLKYWYSRYNIQHAFRMSSFNSIESDSTDSSACENKPLWLTIITWVWKIGTCKCCRCFGILCEHITDRVSNFSRTRYD